MNVVVSYISSKYNYKDTIDLINQTSADGLHVDLMDGNYAGEKNFDIVTLDDLFIDNTKPMDVHLMINNPLEYLDYIIKLNPDCVYIHPETTPMLISLLDALEENNIKRGIAINPDEDIAKYKDYYPYVERVLLMSVVPGKGGQKFLKSTIARLDNLIEYKKDNNFTIYIDGGINNETIKYVSKADGVVSGSYICNSKDYETQINNLRKSI